MSSERCIISNTKNIYVNKARLVNSKAFEMAVEVLNTILKNAFSETVSSEISESLIHIKDYEKIVRVDFPIDKNLVVEINDEKTVVHIDVFFFNSPIKKIICRYVQTIFPGTYVYLSTYSDYFLIKIKQS